MSIRRLISERRLVEILRMNPDSFTFIRKEGRLRSDTRRAHKKRSEIFTDPDWRNTYADDSTASHYYTIESLHDIFFGEKTACNPHLGLPELEAILNGDDGLLTINEVAEKLEADYEHVRVTLIGGGHLAAFHLFGSLYRIPESAFATLHASLNNSDAISAMDAALLLGTVPNVVRTWANDTAHPLERVIVAGKANRVHVNRSSLRRLLASLLPHHITVDEWWSYRLRHQGPVVTTDYVAKRCHCRTTTVVARLASRKIPFIMTPSKQRRIPLEAVQHWIEEETVLSPEELASIFGAPEVSEVPRKLLCPEHNGRASYHCPRRSCIKRYLRANHLPGNFDEDGWLRSTLIDGAAPVPLEPILEKYAALTWGELEEMAQDGVLQAIWMPGLTLKAPRRLMAAAASASTLRIRGRQLEQRLSGPDYHRSYRDFTGL